MEIKILLQEKIKLCYVKEIGKKMLEVTLMSFKRYRKIAKKLEESKSGIKVVLEKVVQQ